MYSGVFKSKHTHCAGAVPASRLGRTDVAASSRRARSSTFISCAPVRKCVDFRGRYRTVRLRIIHQASNVTYYTRVIEVSRSAELRLLIESESREMWIGWKLTYLSAYRHSSKVIYSRVCQFEARAIEATVDSTSTRTHTTLASNSVCRLVSASWPIRRHRSALANAIKHSQTTKFANK